MDIAAPPTATDRPKHIVDILMEERAPHLSASPLWPAVRPLLYSVLNYAKARRMADALAPMGGREALDYVSDLLSVKLEITGLERIPPQGAFLIVANHPTGITDGVALYDAIKTVRPDALVYANSDAHRVCARFSEALIPVEWVLGKRTRERTRQTLKMTDAAIAEGRPIIIFPAGRLARKRGGVLTDPEWMPTGASLARKYALPLLPVHIAGPDAFWFHAFAKLSAELRDITLFHELLNKAGRTYQLDFGPLIPAENAAGEPVLHTAARAGHAEIVAALLKAGARDSREGAGKNSAAMFAASLGFSDVLAALIAQGGDPGQADLQGCSLLCLAARRGDLSTIKLLLGFGVAVNAADAEGQTPLVHAARQGSESAVRLLLTARAAPNAATRDGNTALHIAAAGNRVPVVELLLKSGVSLNARNRRGLTALMMASMAGHPAAVSLLLDSGADPDLVNPEHRTAKDLAVAANHQQVARLLGKLP